MESRLRIEPANSFGVIIDQVLTHFEANRRVDFISHFGGVTLLSQLHFRVLSDNSTEIRCELEFVGTFSRVAGFALGPAIERGAKPFYDDLKRECERQTPSSVTPAKSAAEEMSEGKTVNQKRDL